MAKPERPKGKDPDILSQTEIDMINEYMVNGGDQSKAFRKVRPLSKNWKPCVVHAKASALFAQGKVKIRIAQLRADQEKRTMITADRILQEAFRIGFSDIRLLFNEDGSVKHPKDWPLEVVPAVASVDVVEMAGSKGDDDVSGRPAYIKKVKLWDKNSALEKLFRHFGLYEADNLQKNPFSREIENLPLEVVKLIQEKLREAGGQFAGGRGGGDDTGHRIESGDTQYH